MFSKENISKYLILTVVYVSFAALFWPFSTSLLLASLFAMAMTPLVKKWLIKFKHEKILIFLMVAGLVLIVIAPLTLIVTKGILSIAQLQQETMAKLPIYQNIEITITKAWAALNEVATSFQFDLNESFDIQTLLPRVLQFVVPFLTSLITNFPEFLLQLFVFLTSLYFMLVHRLHFWAWFKDRHLMAEDSLKRLLVLLQKVCYTVVFSTLIVSFVQATIIVAAASIAGFDNLIIIFILTFFVSFFPVVGTAPVALGLAAFSFLQGYTGNGIIMLVALGIAGTVDNIIRAYILSAEDEIHPLISLFTLIGGLSIFGVAGLFLGPIVTELAFSIGHIMNGKDQKVELPPVASSAAESKPLNSP